MKNTEPTYASGKSLLIEFRKTLFKFCTSLVVFAALAECSRILNYFYNIVVLEVCLNFNVLESALEVLHRDGHGLC